MPSPIFFRNTARRMGRRFDPEGTCLRQELERFRDLLKEDRNGNLCFALQPVAKEAVRQMVEEGNKTAKELLEANRGAAYPILLKTAALGTVFTGLTFLDLFYMDLKTAAVVTGLNVLLDSFFYFRSRRSFVNALQKIEGEIRHAVKMLDGVLNMVQAAAAFIDAEEEPVVVLVVVDHPTPETVRPVDRKKLH